MQIKPYIFTNQLYRMEWGSPIPFPTGGACVLSVIRFQDGGRRSAVVSAEARIRSTTPKCIDKRSKNWLDWKVHITPKTQAYDLCSLLFNIIVFVECLSCPDWKSLKLWWRISLNVLSWQDSETRPGEFVIFILSIIIEKEDFEVDCLYKTRWDSYPGIG
jgi:hypothetical protein